MTVVTKGLTAKVSTAGSGPFTFQDKPTLQLQPEPPAPQMKKQLGSESTSDLPEVTSPSVLGPKAELPTGTLPRAHWPVDAPGAARSGHRYALRRGLLADKPAGLLQGG